MVSKGGTQTSAETLKPVVEAQWLDGAMLIGAQVMFKTSNSSFPR
jgi:hypothetical protein